MSKPPKAERSEAALAYIKWQEDNPYVWGDQDENGVDLTWLRENLKLTPAERLRKLDANRSIFKRGRNVRTDDSIR